MNEGRRIKGQTILGTMSIDSSGVVVAHRVGGEGRYTKNWNLL